MRPSRRRRHDDIVLVPTATWSRAGRRARPPGAGTPLSKETARGNFRSVFLNVSLSPGSLRLLDENTYGEAKTRQIAGSEGLTIGGEHE